MNNIESLLNLSAYINTEDVLAVPEPPTKRIALLFVDDLGYFNIRFIISSALNESIVGINNYEN